MYDIENMTPPESEIAPTLGVLTPTKLDILTNKVDEIRSHYVEFDYIEDIRVELRRLVMRDNAVSEGGVMALFGCKRSGKTNLLNDFTRVYDAADKARGRIEYEDGSWAYPKTILYVKVPDASSKNFSEKVLEMLETTPERASPSKRSELRRYDIDDEVIRQCKLRKVRLMVLDECHNSIEDKTARATKDIARKIKNYSNACLFSILVVGTEEAAKLLEASDELAGRCLTAPLRLVPFNWDKEQDRDNCRTLLTNFDRILAKNVFGKMSGLATDDMAMRICIAGMGVIGHIATLVADAGVKAARDLLKKRGDQMTMAHFASAFHEVPFGKGRPNPFLPNAAPSAEQSYQVKRPEFARSGRRATRDTAFRP